MEDIAVNPHYHYLYMVLEILLLRTVQTLIVDIQQFTHSDNRVTLDRRRVYLSDSHEAASFEFGPNDYVQPPSDLASLNQ